MLSKVLPRTAVLLTLFPSSYVTAMTQVRKTKKDEGLK